MKKILCLLTPTLVTTLCAGNGLSSNAATDEANWISFGPQFGLNLTTSFQHFGNSAAGPATGGGLNRTYDDGFVRQDSSGNAGGLTWNWGYQNASQVSGSTLTLHSESSATRNFAGQNDDPHGGIDFAFGHRFGEAPGGEWGWQGAFDYTSVSVHNQASMAGPATLISDAYALGVVIAPAAPYSGSFYGPGPLLGDSPTRTTTLDTLVLTGQRALDANIYAFRTGPYYEFHFGKNWAGRLGGGLALGVADMTVSYNETLTFGSGPVLNQIGSSSELTVQAGGYLEARLLYALNERLSLFAGAQWEYLGTFAQTAGRTEAQLDMSSAVSVLCGVQWRF